MIGARLDQEHGGLSFGAGFRRLARAQNPPVLERGRYELGGCGLAVGYGVFHRSGRGHAGTKRAHEHVAGAGRTAWCRTLPRRSRWTRPSLPSVTINSPAMPVPTSSAASRASSAVRIGIGEGVEVDRPVVAEVTSPFGTAWRLISRCIPVVVLQAASQDVPARPVHDRYQVKEAAMHRDIRSDVGAPDMVRSLVRLHRR